MGLTKCQCFGTPASGGRNESIAAPEQGKEVRLTAPPLLNLCSSVPLFSMGTIWDCVPHNG